MSGRGKKPLVLTVYPQPTPDQVVSFRDANSGKVTKVPMYQNGKVLTKYPPRLDVSKRLANAELAAETYKAEAEFRAAAGYGYSAAIIRECDRKRSVLERFATLPHYDETPGLTAHQEGTQ